MSEATEPSAYFPDRPPTWTEVGIAVLVIVGFAPRLVFNSLSWPAVVVGFLTFAVAIGPAANTALGERIGRWFRRIGLRGRAAVIGSFLICVGASTRVEAIPNELVSDAATGGVFACVAFVLVHIVWAGGVSGWRPGQQ